jgi:hypothetical protein
MEITPPLMPGHVTALVTVKLASSAIAFSYEESAGSSWVAAFEDDLGAGRFRVARAMAGDQDASDPDLLASRQG